jgi:hypothetical protein
LRLHRRELGFLVDPDKVIEPPSKVVSGLPPRAMPGPVSTGNGSAH